MERRLERTLDREPSAPTTRLPVAVVASAKCTVIRLGVDGVTAVKVLLH